MAFIGLKVPAGIARILESVPDVPGDRHSASDMHVTILYLGKGIPVTDVAKAMCAAYQITSQMRPFACGLSEVSSFPGSDDGVPLICPVESPSLHDLNAALKAEFDRLGLEFDNKYSEYKPHVTMSYVTDGSLESHQQPLPGPLAWTASELVIWGGDNGDDVLSVSMPFVLNPGRSASFARMASRLV